MRNKLGHIRALAVSKKCHERRNTGKQQKVTKGAVYVPCRDATLAYLVDLHLCKQMHFILRVIFAARPIHAIAVSLSVAIAILKHTNMKKNRNDAFVMRG